LKIICFAVAKKKSRHRVQTDESVNARNSPTSKPSPSAPPVASPKSLSSESTSPTLQSEGTPTTKSQVPDTLNIKKNSETISRSAKEIEITTLTIIPAGYPIQPFHASHPPKIFINQDPQLFQAYAKEQWTGLSVKIADYLFDQLLLPDFAFKVSNIEPVGAQQIGNSTFFRFIQEKANNYSFKPVAFSDIVGNRSAIEKAQIIVSYLADPAKFGEWAPKNILFHGSPGTGKTLTAKAIASTADCYFIAKKGSELIGQHVGDGASQIHALYTEARENAPTIVFIDELDSIGLNRNFQKVRGDVIEVTTALLAELDGLDPNDSVITIGATNGYDLLDFGLKNRFEEEIQFLLPDVHEREQMLRLFCKTVPFTLDVNYATIAKNTDQWSGRGLHEKLIKIAVHQAILKKADTVTTEDLLRIVHKVQGTEGKIKAQLDFFI